MALAPMGCPCHVHVKTDDRNTWDFHTLKGCYIFTSGDHYRTHNMYIKKTKTNRLSDTVVFVHGQITHPTVSHADVLINAMANFNKCVKHMTTKNTALAKKNGVNMKDLTKLAEMTARVTADHP